MHIRCSGYITDQSFESRNIYRWEDVLGAGSFQRWGSRNLCLLEEWVRGVNAELVWEQNLELEEEDGGVGQVLLFELRTRECSEGHWSSWIWARMP